MPSAESRMASSILPPCDDDTAPMKTADEIGAQHQGARRHASFAEGSQRHGIEAAMARLRRREPVIIGRRVMALKCDEIGKPRK